MLGKYDLLLRLFCDPSTSLIGSSSHLLHRYWISFADLTLRLVSKLLASAKASSAEIPGSKNKTPASVARPFKSTACMPNDQSFRIKRAQTKRRTTTREEKKRSSHNLLPKWPGKINYHWESEPKLDEFLGDLRSTKACSGQDKASGSVFVGDRNGNNGEYIDVEKWDRVGVIIKIDAHVCIWEGKAT
ncbi:hypothetical protein TNIN_205691 [Trichonephila inaurata madagascariensis]|uniref:Uncharacterized protein n=1 Tax=Trichonephila inaurata madagascariensis TaxID=2747483 RepID=A0A8X6XDZ5_9ARAC|nr:hypothetical protein TNIN_205691 [Trichonephila inaurata madagascariensis]